MAKIIKRLSIKTLFGDIDLEKLPEKGAKKLVQIVGIVTGLHVGKSMLGDLVVLKGSFLGLNLETGQKVFSSKCLVPDSLTDEISVLLAIKENNALEFAVVIEAKRNPDIAKGYEFVIVSLVPISKSEPLASLLARVPAIEGFSVPDQKTAAPSKKKVAAKKAVAKKRA